MSYTDLHLVSWEHSDLLCTNKCARSSFSEYVKEANSVYVISNCGERIYQTVSDLTVHFISHHKLAPYSPLGWHRIPRAKTRCQCCTSPSETKWMRTAPPTGCNRAWQRSRHSPHAQIWSRRWLQRRCRPSCPDRGQRAPLMGWRSWCDGPVYHQHHLCVTAERQEQSINIQSA